MEKIDELSITCDSRQVKPGDEFVAIPGFKSDGAEYAQAAVRNGASRVAAERDIPGLGVPVKIVKDARIYLAEEAAKRLGDPSHEISVYGITGTNGKTTSTWILAELLGDGTGYVTTVETNTFARKFESEHTTPDAVSLQKLFAEMRDAGARNCVMEVSSHAAALHRIAGTKFAGGAFTNLTEDHLDFHKTFEAYFKAKLSFFETIAAVNPGAPAAICVDGEWGRKMSMEARRLGLDVRECGFRADDPEFISFIGRMCPLVGRYNVQNVLLASALARAAGIGEERIRALVPKLQPRWGRLERVDTASAGEVFVDFAHTDDALANVLSTVRQFAKGKVWAVFGAGGDRDRAKRPLMGRAAALNADTLVVTSDNPRSENPIEIISQIVGGIPAGTDYLVEPDRREAIRLALAGAKDGDVVVICGKGHETTQTIGDRVFPFDDRTVARGFTAQELQ